ncbi:MAG: hypothetical protein AAB466_03315 [Verrucomicrobiota bacterium]
MATTKTDVAALVAQMPEVDNPGQASKFTGPDPQAAAKIFAEILAGGRESILELIALLREPGDPEYKDYKAGYVLHGLALQAGRPGQEERRRLFAETLASQLGNDKLSQGVKGFLIRELQVAGGQEVVEALGKQLRDMELCEYATQALLAIRDGAAAQLRGALRGATGKNRVTLIQALGVVRDAESIAVLKEAQAEPDRDVRNAAAWALANIAKPAPSRP